MACNGSGCQVVWALLFFHVVSYLATSDLEHGYGEDYDWKSWDEALDIAKESNTPALLIIHSDWCPKSQAQKKWFRTTQELKDKSQDFVMVNLEESNKPADEKYAVTYFPTIMFLEPSGEIMEEVQSANIDFPRYYYYPYEVLAAMDEATEKLKSGGLLQISVHRRAKAPLEEPCLASDAL